MCKHAQVTLTGGGQRTILRHWFSSTHIGVLEIRSSGSTHAFTPYPVVLNLPNVPHVVVTLKHKISAVALS